MKSITKKVVALGATFAMTASFAVSAAEISGVSASVNSADDITVAYTYTGAEDGQATILVYEGETPFADGKGDNVGYINQDTASGSFNFAMRDSLVPESGSKEFNVLVGGTDVATAGKATFTLGNAAPEGFTASFEDDGAAAGESVIGTEITLPEITNNKPNTRYYVGWTKDGGATILAAGEKVTLDADTTFTAVHFGKGDMSQDGSVDGTDADIAYAMEIGDTDYVFDNGFKQFWSDEDPAGAIAGDMSGDGSVDGTDADLAYAMEIGDTDYVFDNGFEQFWED